MSALKKPIFALDGRRWPCCSPGCSSPLVGASAYPPGTARDLGRQQHQPDCGEAVTVSGSHYQPGETVTITRAARAYTVTADSTGTFSLTITIVCLGGRPARHGHRQQLG